MRKEKLLAVSVLGILLHATPAFCQSDEDRAAARSAAQAGATAYDEGRWQDSVDLFSRAEQFVHAPPHLLYLARANVKLNRLVRAREAYLKIVKEEIPATAPKAFRDARTAANEEITALEKRVPAVKLSVTGKGAEDSTLFMDGQKLAAVSGVPVPVDPGLHTFQARGRELESDALPLTVAEGNRTTALTLELKHPVKNAPIATGPATKVDPTSTGNPSNAITPDAPPAQKVDSGLRTAAYVSFGAAVVGAGVGTVFLVMNRKASSDADALCPTNCPESQRDRIDHLDSRANRTATGVWIGYGVAAAGVILGSTFFALSSNGSKETGKSGGAHVGISAGPTGAVVHGVF